MDHDDFCNREGAPTACLRKEYEMRRTEGEARRRVTEKDGGRRRVQGSL